MASWSKGSPSNLTQSRDLANKPKEKEENSIKRGADSWKKMIAKGYTLPQDVCSFDESVLVVLRKT